MDCRDVNAETNQTACVGKQHSNNFLQVRDEAVNALVEIYRHVGERVRHDLSKKDIAPTRY